MNVVHPGTDYLRFILGGKDENRYPAFNGLFTRVVYSHEMGAFVDTMDEMNKLLKRDGTRP